MTTDSTGYGEELVPLEHHPGLWKDVMLETKVASLFEHIEMSSGKKDISTLGGSTFLKPAGQGQAVTAVDLATSKVTLEAFTLKVTVEVSDELDEDSVVALLPSLRQQLVLDGAACIDELLLNADATSGTENINYYGATIPTSSRFLIGFDGMLHLPLVDNTDMKSEQATLSAESFVALLGLMGKYGIDPKQVVFIMDLWTYLKAIQIDEVQTYDKMGVNATLLSGQLASIWGVPIIVSEQMQKADDTGVIDGTTPANNTKGRLLAVNRGMWRVGLRRAVTVRAERNEAAGKTAVTASFRLAFNCFGDRSSATHTALAYNITV
jgi:HK97 family phage major capsid protein